MSHIGQQREGRAQSRRLDAGLTKTRDVTVPPRIRWRRFATQSAAAAELASRASSELLVSSVLGCGDASSTPVSVRSCASARGARGPGHRAVPHLRQQRLPRRRRHLRRLPVYHLVTVDALARSLLSRQRLRRYNCINLYSRAR